MSISKKEAMSKDNNVNEKIKFLKRAVKGWDGTSTIHIPRNLELPHDFKFITGED